MYYDTHKFVASGTVELFRSLLIQTHSETKSELLKVEYVAVDSTHMSIARVQGETSPHWIFEIDIFLLTFGRKKRLFLVPTCKKQNSTNVGPNPGKILLARPGKINYWRPPANNLMMPMSTHDTKNQ